MSFRNLRWFCPEVPPPHGSPSVRLTLLARSPQDTAFPPPCLSPSPDIPARTGNALRETCPQSWQWVLGWPCSSTKRRGAAARPPVRGQHRPPGRSLSEKAEQQELPAQGPQQARCSAHSSSPGPPQALHPASPATFRLPCISESSRGLANAGGAQQGQRTSGGRSEQRGTWHGGLARTPKAKQRDCLRPACGDQKLRLESWMGRAVDLSHHGINTGHGSLGGGGCPQGRPGTQAAAQPWPGPRMGSLRRRSPPRTVPVGVLPRGGAVPLGDLPGRAAHRGRAGPGRRCRAHRR